MAHENLEPSPLTWIGSERTLARRVGRPVRRFMEIEAAGGIVLVLATITALVWANSPWSESYHTILEGHIDVEIGSLIHIDEPLEAWINDALMTVFFFVVGIEIKRELVVGELRDPRAAALPAMAALGGMIVPAAIYLAFNAGTDTADGWGIPMATDIAFALGVVSLLGSRVPSAMKVFLLTLAIVDDIGAIVVIAVFYTDDLSVSWLLLAVGMVVLVVIMQMSKVWYIPAYVLVGMVIWVAVFESGVHATLAGVVLGLLTPARPLRPSPPSDEHVGLAVQGSADVRVVRRASFEIREQVSVAERLEDILHPFTSFFIIPVFALANAGIELSTDTITEAASSRVTLGVVFGLVVGKLFGVSLFTWIGVRSGMSRLPRGASWTHVVGLAAVAGIGFTVSLFITGLAFTSPGVSEGGHAVAGAGYAVAEAGHAVADTLRNPAIDQAKIGILAASTIAASIGVLVLLRAREVIEVEMDEPAPDQ